MTNKLAKDFDRIADVEQIQKWGHNQHYYPYLLRQIDHDEGRVLDVGCGAGSFCAQLAHRAQHITGVDLSANMIAKAKEETYQWPNIEYQVGDYLTINYPLEQFDYIFSIATIHHFSLADFAQKAKRELKPGGKLCVLDLWRSSNLADLITEFVAVPTNWLLTAWYNGQATPSQDEQLAWQAHQASDHYLAMSEVKEISAQHLPNATIEQHLFWRYSLIWTKPVS